MSTTSFGLSSGVDFSIFPVLQGEPTTRHYPLSTFRGVSELMTLSARLR